MKKFLFALPMLALMGCSAIDFSTVPDTFVEGVKDAAKWLFDIFYVFLMNWWVNLF